MLENAIFGGAFERFRSILMTAIVFSLVFVPMALVHGIGAEIQKDLGSACLRRLDQRNDPPCGFG